MVNEFLREIYEVSFNKLEKIIDEKTQDKNKLNSPLKKKKMLLLLILNQK